QLAASPSPSAKRHAAKLRSPPASDVVIAAIEYQSTATLKPRRVPRRSTIRPAIVWPAAYATRNAISTQAKSAFDHRYSVLRYGASPLRVRRAMSLMTVEMNRRPPLHQRR